MLGMKSFPQVNQPHDVELCICCYRTVGTLEYGRHCSQRRHCIATNMSISCLPKQHPKYQIKQKPIFRVCIHSGCWVLWSIYTWKGLTLDLSGINTLSIFVNICTLCMWWSWFGEGNYFFICTDSKVWTFVRMG